MSLETYYRIQIKDKSGKVEFDSGRRPSHSFVIGFIDILYAALHAYADYELGITYSIQIPDVTNTLRNVMYVMGDELSGTFVNEGWMGVKAEDNDDTYGIVIGSGTGPESNSNYALSNKISHGLGAGQFDYQRHNFVNPYTDGNNVELAMSRDFYNGSGGAIDVKEIGIYARTTIDTWPITYAIICIKRELLGATVTVPNQKTLTVQFIWRTTI